MTGTIILNANNLSPNGVFDATTTASPYNRFTMNLRATDLTGRKIALKKMNIWYSWPNITATTSITFQWPVAGSYNSYTWTLPASTNYKDVDALNDSFQSFMITNKLYLINGANNVYYAEIVQNESTYKIDMNLFLVPTSAGTYTAPSGFPGFPTTAKTPTFTIPTGSLLSPLIGFAPGVYDGAAIAKTFSSSYVPQFNPVSSIFITCNLATNDVPINGSTVIGVFTTQGVQYGSMITMESNAQLDYYNIDGNSNLLVVELYDQNWNKLQVSDPQTTIQLQIK